MGLKDILKLSADNNTNVAPAGSVDVNIVKPEIKSNKVNRNEISKSERIAVGKVQLISSIFADRAKLNRDYLMELDSTALLQNFYFEAGIIIPGLQMLENPETSILHWGWEAPTCQLRGHFLGHWMSAASMTVATTKDRELEAKLLNIVDELEKCQKFNGGEWIGSIPEKYFDLMREDRYIWSPQYTMHKTLLGLMHAYQYAGIEKALTILDNVSNWYTRWTEKMAEEQPEVIYRGEEGGMLEVWATLYEITENQKYLVLANRYSDPALFRNLLNGLDALSNRHSNASIPMAQGAAKMFKVTAEDKWLKIVNAFWTNAVTDRGMYATTGCNAGEFWIPPFKQGEYLGDRGQEFCTVYNMVRLADYLYEYTGDIKYQDYIEKCIYNGFLAQQNKHTGMPSYFLPMMAGGRKKWGSRTRDFWCCHGTMVQAQTLYPSLIYRKSKRTIYVNQFIPSILDIEGIKIEQNISMKYYETVALFDDSEITSPSRWSMVFKVTSEGEYTVAIRKPSWITKEPEILIDGKKLFAKEDEDVKATNVKAEEKDGYIYITKMWNNDEIKLLFKTGLSLEKLPDQESIAAVMEGPVVLAGLCESDEGIDIKESIDKVIVPHVEHTYEAFPWLQSNYITRDQRVNFRLVPLYDITDEAYTTYFTIREW